MVLDTIYVKIFRGRKFRGFHRCLALREICILEINDYQELLDAI